MDDIDQTIPPKWTHVPEGDDVTMPGKRDRKPDGRFAVGDLIMSRYKVLSELGQGGMGVVYKCFDETAGIEVALKALPPELSHNTIEMEDIKDNFQLISKLIHQNIAISKNLEKDQSNGNYYLIMECCDGEDLRRWIKQKRKEAELKPEEVLPIIKQIADALDYAHEMKIIHRDIKPGNIMIDHTGKIKVLDFGLAAQIHTSMTRVSMAYHGTSGTGPYMAPEQWRGRAQRATADQYALAVMTYEMLAGHLPFESTDPAVLQQAVLTQTPEEIPNVPQYIQKAITRAMSKEPEERFASCADFVTALAGKKVRGAKKTSSVGMIWKVAVLSLLLVILAGGAGYYFYAQQSSKQEELAQDNISQEEKEESKITAHDSSEKQRISDEYEEKLDSENAALKIELQQKIEDIKQKDYKTSQIFAQKIDQMIMAYEIAVEAKMLITANKKYKEAKELADWILRNGDMLKALDHLKIQAKNNLATAKELEFVIYAPELYQNIRNTYRLAEQLCEEKKYAESKQTFITATNIFYKAKQTALANKLQHLTNEARKSEQAEEWNELKKWAKEIYPFDRSLARRFEEKANKELRAMTIKNNLSAARQAKEEANWKSVINYTAEVLKLDRSCSEARMLKQEAEQNLIPRLEIIATINGSRVPATVNFGTKDLSTMNHLSIFTENESYNALLLYQVGVDKYMEKINFDCNWNGLKKMTVELKKQKFRGGIIPLPHGVKLEMVEVLPGSFIMHQNDGTNYGKQFSHRKKLTYTYFLGKYEVTNEQWCAVMNVSKTPSLKNKGAKYPVENITWRDAMKFCEKMNQYAPSGWCFTLPTETQWEFAARGGNNSNGYKCSGSNDLYSVGWYEGNSNSTTHKVGSKAPNELGLYDMSGNVWEWCLDNWQTESSKIRAEFRRPYNDKNDSSRALRGGSWGSNVRDCRSANRNYDNPDNRNNDLGFRLALVPLPKGTTLKTRPVINPAKQPLSTTAEDLTMPTLTVQAYVNGQIVNANVKAMKAEPDRESTPWKLKKGSEYEFIVTYMLGDQEYIGWIPAFTCTSNGLHNKEVVLKKLVFNGVLHLPNGIKLNMVKIKAGSFMMGNMLYKPKQNLRERRHRVTLTKDYWLGQFEVTQAQWYAVMNNNPSTFKGSNRPVECVSWKDAKDFCAELNKRYDKLLPKGYKFDLPTEAQWEYACRANTTTIFSYGNMANIKSMNFLSTNKSINRKRTVDVGSLGYKNAWGLYDMHGNVQEWCRDWYRSYYNGGKVLDPLGPKSGSMRVERGGSWNSTAEDCRSASRGCRYSNYRSSYTGFRLALVPIQ